MAMSDPSLPEVLVVLPADPSHRLLEAGELILQVFKVVFQDVQLSRLLAHQLP